MAIVEKSLVSEGLLNEIQRAEVIHDFILKTIPDRIIADTEEKILVVSLFSLALEHHRAILHLFKAGPFDGSALALVRPLIDAAYRAHWIYSCATPEIIRRISEGRDEIYPRWPNLALEVEKRIGTGGYFAAIVPHIHTLHGYTHGGIEQLARRYDTPDGDVKPSYPDAIKIESVKVITAHLTALAIAYCQVISPDPSGKTDPCAKAISEFYIPHAKVPDV